jgi:hypothetical protein
MVKVDLNEFNLRMERTGLERRLKHLRESEGSWAANEIRELEIELWGKNLLLNPAAAIPLSVNLACSKLIEAVLGPPDYDGPIDPNSSYRQKKIRNAHRELGRVIRESREGDY